MVKRKLLKNVIYKLASRHPRKTVIRDINL